MDEGPRLRDPEGYGGHFDERHQRAHPVTTSCYPVFAARRAGYKLSPVKSEIFRAEGALALPTGRFCGTIKTQ